MKSPWGPFGNPRRRRARSPSKKRWCRARFVNFLRFFDFAGFSGFWVPKGSQKYPLGSLNLIKKRWCREGFGAFGNPYRFGITFPCSKTFSRPTFLHFSGFLWGIFFRPGRGRPRKFPKCHTKRLPGRSRLVLKIYRVLKLKKTHPDTIEPVEFEDF